MRFLSILVLLYLTCGSGFSLMTDGEWSSYSSMFIIEVLRDYNTELVWREFWPVVSSFDLELLVIVWRISLASSKPMGLSSSRINSGDSNTTPWVCLTLDSADYYLLVELSPDWGAENMKSPFNALLYVYSWSGKSSCRDILRSLFETESSTDGCELIMNFPFLPWNSWSIFFTFLLGVWD